VQGELQVFQAKLNSETILTDPELDRLRQFDSQLQPPRPARLRRKSETPVESNASDQNTNAAEGSGDDTGAPSWEDMSGDQSFRSSPNFRSFSKLCQERNQLWQSEAAWLKGELVRTQETSADVARLNKLQEQQEQALKEEEVSLRSEAAALHDFEGHQRRHSEALEEGKQAREAQQRAATDAAEAQLAMEKAQAALDQCEAAKKEADAALVAARGNAQKEVAVALRIRNDLQARTSDLESRCREYLHEWRAVELEEHRLKLLQVRVTKKLSEEANGRQLLRAEAQELIRQLRELDQQLDVPDAPQACCP